jgi:MFS family permease
MEKQSNQTELFHSIWNSSFIRIIVYALLCQFTMSISNTVLPLYVINGLGRSAAESGLLGTVFTIGSVCCRFFAGYISDKFGRRVTLTLGAGIVAIALFALGFQTTLIMLLVFKVIQGVGHALNSTASNAVAAEVLPRDQVGQGIGFYSLHSMLTNAIGPTLCLVLMSVGVDSSIGEQNYQVPMVMGGVMGVVAVLIALSMGYEKKLHALHPETAHKPQGIKLNDFIERRALLPALMMFFTSFASGAAVYMIVFANEYNFSTISIYYVVNALVSVGVRFAFGSKLDRLRPRTVAVIAIAINVVSYALLGFTLSEWSFMLSAVLMGIYQSMLTPTFNAMAMKMVPESRSGAASSTYWLGFDGGMAIGMLFFGVIIDWGSYPAAFLFSALYMAIFGVIAYFVLRKVPALVDIESPKE